MRPVCFALVLFVGACAASAESEIDVRGERAVEACVAGAGAERSALEACTGLIAAPCLQTEGGRTTGGMVQCYAVEAAAWNALLEGALERAQADASRRALLDSAQQDWLAARQSECAYRASLYAGGSLARVLQTECFADLTARRAIDLIHAERSMTAN